MTGNVLEYIPFGAAICAMLGLAEARLAKKVDKEVFDERIKVVDRIEGRMITIENHLIGRALTKKEAEAVVAKKINNKRG